jgi:hypothetical protein
VRAQGSIHLFFCGSVSTNLRGAAQRRAPAVLEEIGRYTFFLRVWRLRRRVGVRGRQIRVCFVYRRKKKEQRVDQSQGLSMAFCCLALSHIKKHQR